MSRRKKNVQDQAPVENIRVTDAFSNPLFRLGFGSQSPIEATEYPLTRLTENYALLNSLYRTNWIVQNVVSIVPEDMTREWFTLEGTITPEMQADFDRAQRTTQLKSKVTDGLRWGRLYGGAVGLILIRGQESVMDQPLDLESILPGSFAGLMIRTDGSGSCQAARRSQTSVTLISACLRITSSMTREPISSP